MSEAPPTWHTNLYAIIQQPGRSGVLLLAARDGWTLPTIRLKTRHWTPEVEPVHQAIRETFGFDTIVLRCAGIKIDRDAQQLSVLYVLEPRDRSWTPPADSCWIERAALDDLTLGEPEQRMALQDYFDDPGSTLRPSWGEPGWFDSVERWIHEQLAQRGYQATAPVEQIKTWGISCVLRSPTTSGNVYFKVASRGALFSDEPSLMAALATEHPDYIPAPLAIAPEQRWMLLPDVGAPLRKTLDLQTWQTALRVHSQIQQSFVGRAESVLAIGCLDRRLERLAVQIEALLSNNEALARMTGEELQQAQALRPRFQQMCRELASYGLPQTLAHGDLHGGNIALRDGCYLFFDWTDGCLAHPFFDLVTMLEDVEEFFDGVGLDDLVDAYLEQWTCYAPIERLREAWRLAQPLGEMHQAISNHYIVESLEPASKHELAGAIPYWIRKAMRNLPA